MNISKAMNVVLWCTLLVYSGVCGSCYINPTTFTADCSHQDLDRVPSYVPDSTKVLDLSGNLFKEVHLRHFRRFYNLVKLDLKSNYIKYLGNDSDTELLTLRVLDISKNRLRYLNNAFFIRIPNLQKLSISYNGNLIVSTIRGLRNLTILDMSSIEPINVNSTPFKDLEYLKDLNHGWCRLRYLRDTMFTGLSNLLKLNLRWNDMHDLPSGVFLRLIKLKYLDMSNNMLEYLPSGVFAGLSKLKDLNLSFNRMNHLPSGVFARLINLKFLVLSVNNLDHLPNGIFVGLTKLKVLDLGGNPLYYITSLPTDIFHPLIHLEELNLNTYGHLLDTYTYMDNQISKIPTLKRLYITGAPNKNFGPGFTVLIKLEYLYITGNLSVINNETFVNLKYTHSLTLSLVGCEFSSIFPNAFTSLKNLTLLDVSYNNFLCKKSMRSNFTTAICNSRVKSLIATNMQCPFHFYPWYYCDSPDLELLDMSNNNLATVFAFPFTLKELYLANNNIDSLDLLTLYHMYNLEKLDLSDQTQIPDDSNTHLKKGKTRTTGDTTDSYKLNTVSLAPFYNITKTYTDFKQNGQNIDSQARNMTFKDQNVNVTTLSRPIPAFLKWIDVSKSGLICDLCKLDNTNNSVKIFNISGFRPNKHCSKWLDRLWPWLHNLIKLEYLDLRGDHITTIPAEAFTHTTHLKHLDLAENHLATLTFETKSLGNLKILNLSDNIIQYAYSQFTEDIKSNDLKIYLDHNDFLLCDCDRLSFVHWLSTSNVVYNITGLMCKYANESQVSLRQRAAIYHQLKYECPSIVVIVSCVLVFISVLLGGCGIAILCHKRWKENYLSVFVRSIINPYHPLEECHIELEYDIYISYERDHDITANETLHDLVTKKLYPWFKQRGFKVLSRDELYAGRKLYSEISQALRKSRNVIVLLSNDYCVDFWNVFEFNTAAMEGIYTKRRIIIPVSFEILKPEVFHEEITTFLKSVPLPRYTPNTSFTVLANYLLEKIMC